MPSSSATTTAAQRSPDAAEFIERQGPRYFPNRDVEMTLVIEREQGRTPRLVEGTILDLSAGGVKALVRDDFSIDEPITAHWELESLGHDLAIPAHVCWCRSANEGTWRIGCAFETEFPW